MVDNGDCAGRGELEGKASFVAERMGLRTSSQVSVAIGLEMEAAGTMNCIPVAVICGVCDYGDQLKTFTLEQVKGRNMGTPAEI